MLRKTITYTDYNGEERTEDFYFNLSKAELVELELSTPGGFAEYLTQIAESNDGKAIIENFKKIIKMAYGVRSEDGKRFIKSDELFEEFAQTEAYSELFVELATDAASSADFINGIAPKGLAQEAAQVAREKGAVQNSNVRKPQDRLPKQVKDQRRTKTTEIVEDPVEIEKTEQPALASEPAQRVKEHYSLEELTQMPREELQALQERGLDGSPAEGYTVRPPHESGQGFQQS